eukprot:1869820-Alexandrium_andersonii.AAC.1
MEPRMSRSFTTALGVQNSKPGRAPLMQRLPLLRFQWASWSSQPKRVESWACLKRKHERNSAMI